MRERESEIRIVRSRDVRQIEPYYPSGRQAASEGPGEMDEGPQMDLMDYWRILVKRRWLVASMVTASLIVTVIATWTAKPVYRATTRIQIDPEPQNALPFQDISNPGATYAQSKEYLETQVKVLGSNELAGRVIRELNLGENAAFAGEEDEENPSVVVRVKLWAKAALGLGRNLDELSEEELGEAKRLALVGKFGEGLTVEPVRNSRLVDVSFDSPKAWLAAAVAGAVAEQYIQLNFETKYEATNAAADFMAGKLIDLKARVEKSDEELAEFGRQHNIYAVTDRQNVTMQKLSDLNAALTSAQTERIQKESVWNVVRQTEEGSYPEILRNDLVKSLERNVSDLKQKKANLEATFLPDSPMREMREVSEQLEEAERQLRQERQRALRNAETEYATASRKEELLTHALEAQKEEVDALNQDSIQYNILQRQVETDRQLYDGLLQRMKEAGVSAGMQSSNVHVVDAAETPVLPHSPNRRRNLAVGLGAGLLLGVGLAFFVERLDSSIKTPDDIDRFLDLPSLGMIPSVWSVEPRKRLAAGETRAVGLVAHTNGMSRLSEAYRDLRASVTLAAGGGERPRVLLLTSSQAEEGKTTTAVNLAITLAQTEARVVLVDCDMRRPQMHGMLGLENRTGLSRYLSGRGDAVMELKEAVMGTEVPNLDVIPAGPPPRNPAELLGSSRMRGLLSELASEYEYVVIDSPPVLSVSDARVLAAEADGVILVVKGGETPKEAVRRSKRLIESVGGRVLGTLLNNVNVRGADYQYGGGYYNSYVSSYRGDAEEEED